MSYSKTIEHIEIGIRRYLAEAGVKATPEIEREHVASRLIALRHWGALEEFLGREDAS